MRNSSEIVAMRKLASSKIFRVLFYQEYLNDIRRTKRLDLKELNNEIATYYKNKTKLMLRREANVLDMDKYQHLHHPYDKKYKVEWGSFVPKTYITKSYREVFDEYDIVSTAKFKEKAFADMEYVGWTTEMGFKIFATGLSEKDLKQLLHLGLKYKSWPGYYDREKLYQFDSQVKIFGERFPDHDELYN